MPTMTVRSAAAVPQPSRVSRAVREQQEVYEAFIKQVGQDVGELVPSQGEQIRSLKVRLRRASTRLNLPIEIWDADDNVYFSLRSLAPRRGRPRKNAAK